MALTVKQLNDDTSFMLTFKPSFAPDDCKSTHAFPGSYTILIDPWLSGSTTIFHHKFATSTHTSTPTIQSLKEVEDEIDLIIISQDKPDHCNEETLCSLPKLTRTRILATPKAAKKIRSWNYFERPGIVEELVPYSAYHPDTILRIPIDPYSSASAEGEVTIANISTKTDLTRLHNAIAITYCPPGTLMTAPDGSTVNLSDLPVLARQGVSHPLSRNPSRKRPSVASPKGIFKAIHNLPQPSPTSLTSPDTSRPSTSGAQRPSTSSTLSKRHQNHENVLSILYTPHGIDPPLLRPYIETHLSLLPRAIPITALFHSLNIESNPKILGGTVSSGAPGGIEIVKEVDVRYWIAAHDEMKENEGWATKWITSQKFEVEDVIRMLRGIGGIAGEKGKRTIIEILGTGGVRTLRGG
ncbi:uncharacterized protein MYCFIDRAFT_216834 [Pseudocercospora fijiensis CIRAD86]|uniref:Uncharacterized protein n=1 Tax=Pseudocercospora fijiensis (strain CIRAD86) TaxID=383855 RepID=M2ZES2_PSEFD|nr:uncharacterized protein MYCFIDRAFT_216834 [Pseudocercospora fijiensis CIRAD86]EME77629.1 hypothetical protein MYCFIDRAFT_216834 [Pseudocercospora fijiensis CIRAD86]